MNFPFENPLFLIPVISGLIFVIAGVVMLKFPPKNINSLYGYRTESSMRNKERWDFAQKRSAIEMIRLGILLTISGCVGLVFEPDKENATILGLVLMIMMVVVLLIRVERAINNEFSGKK